MTTIRDVARRAGVSPITASRVVSGVGYASAETRRRVQTAVAELGYVPNTLARSLRSRRSNTLALILTDITNPFWTTVARGVEDTARTAGFTVILCNSDEEEAKQDEYLRLVLQKRVDGILLVPARSKAAPLAVAREHGIPVVVLDRSLPGSDVDIVRCDSAGGAYQLASLLLALGHRHIAMLSGPQEVSTAADRVAGYQRALAERGLAAAAQVLSGEFTIASGYAMAGQALARQPRPTALFAANNFIAIGAVRAVRAAGLLIPGDVALVGFDDLPPALVIDPFLTVAAQPAYEMGKRATEVLVARLGGKGAGYQEIVLPTEIVVRASSGGVVN